MAVKKPKTSEVQEIFMSMMNAMGYRFVDVTPASSFALKKKAKPKKKK